MKNKILRALVAGAAVVFAFAAQADDAKNIMTWTDKYGVVWKYRIAFGGEEAYIDGDGDSAIDPQTYGSDGWGTLIVPSSIDLPNGRTYPVTWICDFAFKKCLQLQHIKIPDSVYGFGESIFEGCECLKSVKIPGGVVNIPQVEAGNWYHLFDNCFPSLDILYVTGVPSQTVQMLLDNFCNNLARPPRGAITRYVEEDDIPAGFSANKAITKKGVVYNGWEAIATVEISISKINKNKQAKLKGSVTDLAGKKHTITAQTLNLSECEGNDVILYDVSLEVKRMGNMYVDIGADGQFAGYMDVDGDYCHVQSVEVDSRGGGVGGTWLSRNVHVEVGDDLTAFSGLVLDGLLPRDQQGTCVGGKWTFPSAASVKLTKVKAGVEPYCCYNESSGMGVVVDTSKDHTNLSALKLSYTPKKGVFKGTFYVYAVEEPSPGKMKLKKYKFNVNGVVVNGVGYGTATCKSPAVTWSVTVK